MKLHSCRFAPNPHKVRLAIAELKLPCEELELDVRARQNHSPAFLALNPNGHLPVLEDERFVLWESDAILAYLGKKHVKKGLWPTDLWGEADAWRWLLYELATLQPPVADIWGERWLYPWLRGKAPDEGLVAAAWERVKTPLSVLNQHLGGREHVLGRFTLVDCSYAAVLNMLAVSDVSLDEWPNVAAYFERLRERESFAACPLEKPGR